MRVAIILDVAHVPPWVNGMSERTPAGSLVLINGASETGNLIVNDGHGAWFVHPSSVEILGTL